MNKMISRLLIIACLFLGACQNTANSGNGAGRQQQSPGKRNAAPAGENPRSEDAEVRTGDDAINRHPGRLVYSKHARCRMDCRHIDESEVMEILQQGRINYRKSEPAGRPDPKYALEGTTHDGQQVRIVFAMPREGQKVVVVTVIDLDTEWTCDCK